MFPDSSLIPFSIGKEKKQPNKYKHTVYLQWKKKRDNQIVHNIGVHKAEIIIRVLPVSEDIT